MADITTVIDQVFKQHDAHLSHSRRTRSDTRDKFLKEAYRIVPGPPYFYLSCYSYVFKLNRTRMSLLCAHTFMPFASRIYPPPSVHIASVIHRVMPHLPAQTASPTHTSKTRAAITSPTPSEIRSMPNLRRHYAISTRRFDNLKRRSNSDRTRS